MEQHAVEVAQGSDTAAAPASSSSAPAQPENPASHPESNMYGEAIITVPTVNISDDKDDHEGKGSAAAVRTLQDNDAQPVPSLDISRVFSMFYREGPAPESGIPQRSPEPARQTGPATAVNKFSLLADHIVQSAIFLCAL